MNEQTYLKLKFICWIEDLSKEEIEQLVVDARECHELDRCFQYCVEEDCHYYSLIFMLRTPGENYRYHLIEWVKTADENILRSLLETGVVCGEQSFCIKYCASSNCLFKKLINHLCEISCFKI